MTWSTQTDWDAAVARDTVVTRGIGDRAADEARIGYDPTYLPSSLEAYLTHDEDSGTTAADATGNGHDGSINGSVTVGAQGVLGSTALDFPGATGDNVTIPNSSVFQLGSSGAICWVGWLKTTDAAANRMFSIHMGDGTAPAMQLRVNSNGYLESYVQDGTSTANAVGSTNVADGVLHHVGFRYRHSDSTLENLLDGSVDGSATQSLGDVSPTSKVEIGTYNGGNALNAIIDEPMFFSDDPGDSVISSLADPTAASLTTDKRQVN